MSTRDDVLTRLEDRVTQLEKLTGHYDATVKLVVYLGKCPCGGRIVVPVAKLALEDYMGSGDPPPWGMVPRCKKCNRYVAVKFEMIERRRNERRDEEKK